MVATLTKCVKIVPELNLGVSLASLRLPLKRSLPLLAEWKIRALELDARNDFRPKDFGASAMRELRKLLQDHSLQVGMVAYLTRRGYAVEADLEPRIEGTKTAFKFAAALGCTLVSNHIGLIPDDTASAEWKLLTQVLTDLSMFGQHHGVTLCAQTGPQPASSLARLLAALPEGALGIELNPGELLVQGHEPEEIASQLGGYVMHVRASDAVRGFGLSRGQLVPLGQGAADWPNLLGTLQEWHYRGFYTLFAGGREPPSTELEAGIRYLRSL